MIGNFLAILSFNRLEVQDDLKLSDDGGEIPKSQERGWRL